MPPLRKTGAARLLKIVGGKQHASENDHEESHGRQDDENASSNLNEEEVNREPVSSGDEGNAPPIPKSARLANPTNSAQKRKAGPPSPGLRKPPPKSTSKASAPRPPRLGNYQMNQEEKTKRGPDGKEKPATTPSLSRNGSSGGFDFGLHSQPSSQSKKQTYDPKRNGTSNIHARPPGGKVTFSKKQRAVFNSMDEAGDESDVEMEPLNDDELDETLGSDKSAPGTQLNRPQMKKKRTNDTDASEATAYGEAELDDLLGSSQPHKPAAKKKRTEDEDPISSQLRKPEPKKKRQEGEDPSQVTAIDDEELESLLGPHKPNLLRELGDWIQDHTPGSSQPQFSAPQEDTNDLADLEGYIHELPEEAPEGTICTICHEPVSPSDYWTFWTHKAKTVKNQTAFCTSHRRQTAQDEYTREGYPEIHWNGLPARIKKHRMTLHKVLANDTPSTYRDRYAPLALTGKAAAVPSSRRTGIDSTYTLDDHSTYPGYYGARGRRAITEAVMSLLRNEIKRSRDPVVQTSGPAAFVQAVLVPEVAVLLIMEDCEVDRDEAEAVRERTYEMGLLLNEEIEDEIEVRDESSGDEYGGQ